jgi:hypothetical protein
MDKNELEVYKQAVKEKYKYYRLWKVLAIIFMCLSVIFGALYFATGDVFRTTTNDVEIVNNNEGDSNTNNSVTINN